MSDELGNGGSTNRSWLKTGCLAIVGVFAVLVVLALIGNAMMTPEDRAAAKAEREADAAEALAQERADAQAQAQEMRDSARPVTASELQAAYSSNEVAAQREYGGQPLLVTGVIEAVELDFMDEPMVRLRTGEMFMTVTLGFDAGAADDTAGLSRGDTVEALCQEVSEVIGSPILSDWRLYTLHTHPFPL